MKKKPWYEKGLPFKCTGCGACCTGAPGYVWVTKEEIQQIADFLKISYEDCVKRYTRRVGSRISLIEDPDNYDCVFLKGKLCTIYSARPVQCRTFPFWKGVVASQRSWEETGQYCEGINHPDASLISIGHIEEELKKQQ